MQVSVLTSVHMNVRELLTFFSHKVHMKNWDQKPDGISRTFFHSVKFKIFTVDNEDFLLGYIYGFLKSTPCKPISHRTVLFK